MYIPIIYNSGMEQLLETWLNMVLIMQIRILNEKLTCMSYPVKKQRNRWI